MAPMAEQKVLLHICAAVDLPGSCPALLLYGWCSAMRDCVSHAVQLPCRGTAQASA